MAPEVDNKTCKDGKAADIYSMGEVFNRITKDDNEKLLELIRRCKHPEPEERPEIEEVIESLELISGELGIVREVVDEKVETVMENNIEADSYSL